MPDYKLSKIYAIRSHQTDQIYIGATVQSLAVRFAEHKKPTNKSNSKEILKYEDAYIELIEEYPCENKEQLSKKEGEHIRANNCVNKCIAGRTSKEYRKDNQEHLNEKRKEWLENNQERFNEKNKEYYQKNKDKIKDYQKQYQKEYYQKNKERINQKE